MPKKPSDNFMNSSRPGAWRSRLRPYEAEIWAMHRKGESLQTIADMLQGKYGLKVVKSSVHGFIKAREAKYRKCADIPPHPSDMPVVAAQPAIRGVVKVVPTVQPHPLSEPDLAERQARHGNSKNQSKVGNEVGSMGFPIPKSQEVIGKDRTGRSITRNKPFSGEV